MWRSRISADFRKHGEHAGAMRLGQTLHACVRGNREHRFDRAAQNHSTSLTLFQKKAEQGWREQRRTGLGYTPLRLKSRWKWFVWGVLAFGGNQGGNQKLLLVYTSNCPAGTAVIPIAVVLLLKLRLS